MIEGIMMLYLLGICLVAAVTDWKKGKIYNRWLSLGMIPASILVVLYYYGHRESIRLFLMNLLAAIAIAIIFYALKMWGAGDSKLWIFLNLQDGESKRRRYSFSTGDESFSPRIISNAHGIKK